MKLSIVLSICNLALASCADKNLGALFEDFEDLRISFNESQKLEETTHGGFTIPTLKNELRNQLIAIQKQLVRVIDEKFGQLDMSEPYITKHYTMCIPWLIELSRLNEDSLGILLHDDNYDQLLGSYNNLDESKLLEHAKSRLYLEDFFPLTNSGIIVPKAVEQEIFVKTLSLDQISSIFLKHTHPESLNAGSLKDVDKEKARDELRDLLMEQAKEQLLEILGKRVPKFKSLLQNFSFQNSNSYETLIEEISDCLEKEKIIWEKLELHTFFTNDLSTIKSQGNVKEGIRQVIISKMFKVISPSYKYLLSHIIRRGWLIEFLLLQSHRFTLTGKQSNWELYLDNFVKCHIEGTKLALKELLRDSLGFEVEYFHVQQYTNWGQIVKRYIEERKRSMKHTYNSIKTLEQLGTIEPISRAWNCSLGINVIQTICHIIDGIKNEFIYWMPVKYQAPMVNLYIGTRKTMGKLIQQYPAFDHCLKVVCFDTEYGYQFFKALSRTGKNGNFGQIDVLDKFVTYLIKKNKLQGFISSVSNIMPEPINASLEELEGLDTVQKLLEWISLKTEEEKVK